MKKEKKKNDIIKTRTSITLVMNRSAAVCAGLTDRSIRARDDSSAPLWLSSIRVKLIFVFLLFLAKSYVTLRRIRVNIFSPVFLYTFRRHPKPAIISLRTRVVRGNKNVSYKINSNCSCFYRIVT